MKHYYTFEVFLYNDAKKDWWSPHKSFVSSGKYRQYSDVFEALDVHPKNIKLLPRDEYEQEAIVFSYKKKKYMIVHVQL